MNTLTNNTFQLKAYSIGELSKMYNVNRCTFKKWIEPFSTEIGKRRGRFYTVIQVKLILKKWGCLQLLVKSKNDFYFSKKISSNCIKIIIQRGK